MWLAVVHCCCSLLFIVVVVVVVVVVVLSCCCSCRTGSCCGGMNRVLPSDVMWYPDSYVVVNRNQKDIYLEYIKYIYIY